MFNRILKRPMFRRGGGPSFQAQGTGITSPYDTPRRGLVQYPGGYAGRTIEDIQADREAVVAPKPYEDINDIIKSFGVYSAPYAADGNAMTTGEMGWNQAQMIDKIRTERQGKRDLAELEGLEKEEAALIRDEERAHDIAKIGETGSQQRQGILLTGDINMSAQEAKQAHDIVMENNRQGHDLEALALAHGYDINTLNVQQVHELEKMAKGLEYDKTILGMEQNHELLKLSTGFGYDKELTKLAAKLDKETQLETIAAQGEFLDFKQRLKEMEKDYQAEIASLPPMHPEEKDAYLQQLKKDYAENRESIITQNKKELGLDLRAEKIATAIINNPNMMVTDMKEATKMALQLILGIQGGLDALGLARGGRVGYQMGTPNTGAMPIQASATETINTPNTDITATETVTEGQQQSSVQMPYEEFRAAIPAEVGDEIVQLIYYNQDAFADFSQITSQADVYAFNNKYGVSLVLPMDTETT